MTQSMDLLKLKKITKTIRLVMQAFFWTAMVVGMLSFIVFVVIQFVNDRFFLLSRSDISGFSLTLDGIINFRIDQQVLEDTSLKPIYSSIFLMASVCSVGLTILFRQIAQILITVERDMPFTVDNVKRITTIGVVLMIGSMVYRAAGAVVAMAIIHTFDIPNMQVNIGIDLFMTLSGFMMLVLAGVFKYGNYLQQEYDATL